MKPYTIVKTNITTRFSGVYLYGRKECVCVSVSSCLKMYESAAARKQRLQPTKLNENVETCT